MFVPELLARTGFPVDTVMTPHHPLRGARGISQAFIAEDSKWAAEIEAKLLTGDYLRFYNNDEFGLKALYRHAWSHEAAKFLPLVPGTAAAGTVNSKSAFYDWCLQEGLPIPETYSCNSFSEACALQEKLVGAWLLKGDTGCSGSTVMRSATDRHAGLAKPQGEPWLVQRDVGQAVGSAMFLAERGELLGWIATKNMVRLSDGFGVTVLGRGDTHPDIGELCRHVAKASGVTGLTGFDFVRTADRGPLLIDSHLGRMCPMLHFDRLYGVDFAGLLREHLNGNTNVTVTPSEGPLFVKFPEVIDLIFEGGLLRLLKGFCPPIMPLAPHGDLVLGLRIGLSGFLNSLRAAFGRWRRGQLRKICRG